MTSINRGTKRRCTSCGAAYYDLNRSPVACPKCHAPYVEAPRVPVRASRIRPAEPPLLPEEPADDATTFEEDETLPEAGMDEDMIPDEDHDEDDGEDRD